MSVTPGLPHELGEFQRVLDDLLRLNAQLHRQAEEARRRAEAAQRRIDELERLLEQDGLRQQAEAARQQAEDARRRIEELERILDQTAADYQQLQEKHDELAETLALLLRYVFGQRRERFRDAPGQGHLFDIPEILTEPEPAAPPPVDDAAARPPKPARPPRRTRLDHLPHIRIEYDLPESEKTCSCCGGPKQKIGEDLSRELDFIPAQLNVKLHVLPKYPCPKCRDGVASPPVPPKPIPGGIAGVGLVSKFADHLPLYRLEDILTRHGVFLARSTLCDWVRNAAIVLKPLADLQKTLVLQSPIIWTDDTSVTVLGGEEPGSSTGRFWVNIGDDAHPYSVYDFNSSRSRDGPAAFPKDYRGFLQADAYGGYDGIFLGSNGTIVEVACWAHARRKFFEARSNAPREANEILEWIQQLYDIEDRACDLTPEERQALRQRATVLFTIRAGAKHHHLEPWAYLRDVLLRLSAGETELESLLPDRWAASHPEHVLQHRLDESRRKAARQKARGQRRRVTARR